MHMLLKPIGWKYVIRLIDTLYASQENLKSFVEWPKLTEYVYFSNWSLPEPLGFENKEKRFIKRVFQSFNFVRLL